MIRAVALDIDGTLTDDRRRLHLGAVDALRRIEARGVPVVMATGNVLCITEIVAVMTGASGPVIAENGGIIKDIQSGDVRLLGDISAPERAYQYLKERFDIRKLDNWELRKTEIAIDRNVPVQELVKALGGDFGVELVDTKYAIHIKKRGVNKGRALVEVAGMMGLDVRDFAAIGDSESDREMLEVSGYGISIAEEGLEDVSDAVTERSFGDGG
ncbi:MAG: phosphoglycolate phosphatase, partial [Euryarchaeota archaeon]|nr:phosphoglycolate phosphatase [Euryarchaeota archaeon]